MAIRKLYVAIDCDTDEQKEQVQQVLNELSNMRIITGRQILSSVPMIQKNRNDLYTLFNMIKQGGIKSLFSLQGGMLINRLAKSR